MKTRLRLSGLALVLALIALLGIACDESSSNNILIPPADHCTTEYENYPDCCVEYPDEPDCVPYCEEYPETCFPCEDDECGECKGDRCECYPDLPECQECKGDFCDCHPDDPQCQPQCEGYRWFCCDGDMVDQHCDVPSPSGCEEIQQGQTCEPECTGRENMCNPDTCDQLILVQCIMIPGYETQGYEVGSCSEFPQCDDDEFDDESDDENWG